MDREEWGQLATAVNQDIAKMAASQRLRDGVHDAIRFRAANPTEEQFIDEDLTKQPVGEPQTFIVAGIEIKVWKLHRLGLQSRDVSGADLLYEITDTKFVLIQYKSPNRRDRVLLDPEQMSELQNACPVPCLPSDRFSCGAWLAVRSVDTNAYFPACEAKQIFSQFKSRKVGAFINRLSKPQFQLNFGLCRIGARTNPIDINDYREFSMDEDRVFIHVKQGESIKSS